MKKLLAIIALVLSCVCLFVACDVATYQSDADYHWVQGNESSKEPHAWDKGEVIKEATETESGERRFTCTVCGYQLTQEIPAAHTHTYAHGWSSDKFGHWHAGTCEHPEAQDSFAEHTFDGGVVTEPVTNGLIGTVVYTCTVCGWQKTEELAPDHTEHVWTWNATVTEHWQEKACCDTDEVENRGYHTYDENYVCTVCGKYSVIEAIKDELTNKQSGTFVVTNLVLPFGGITINELAINFAFDSSANLVGQAHLDIVEATGGVTELDGDEVQAVRQKVDIVLRDGTFYVITIDYKADGITVAHTGYSKNSPTQMLKKLMNFVGAEYDEQLEQQIAGYAAEIINTLYAASDDIKAVLDVLEGVAAQLPDMSYAQILESYFVKQTIEGVVYYHLNWDVFRQLNDALSQLTIGDVLQLILGQNDVTTLVPAMVTQILNTTMGDLIDGLKEQGVDLYELNEQINAVLAEYGVTLESIVKNYFDLRIADGLLIADYIDSIIVRPYKVIDLINMMVDGDSEITVEQIVAAISSAIDTYTDVTVYDVVALPINIVLIGANQENAEHAFAGESMRYVLSSALDFLWDFVVVRVEFNDTLTAINGWHIELGYGSTYVTPEEPTEYWSEITFGFFNGIREMLSDVSGKVMYTDNYTFTNSANSIVNEVERFLGVAA